MGGQSEPKKVGERLRGRKKKGCFTGSVQCHIVRKSG